MCNAILIKPMNQKNAMPITVLGIGAKSIFVSDEINKQNVHL